jgi:UDP-N-acetylmuramoylalanine--D-glutamate ligase
VARTNQFNYINDSRATSVAETWNSLNVMTEEVVLILGGIDRRGDYNQLTELIGKKAKAVICMGSERDKIFSAYMDVTLVAHALSLEEAVQMASKLATAGSAVLFSPSCPSCDAFDNYKNRGNKFKLLVSQIV